MDHFASAQQRLRYGRWTTLAASAALFAAAHLIAPSLNAQTASTSSPVKVSLTPAAFLPATSRGSIKTTVATDMNGSAANASPWKVALVHLDRNSEAGGAHYTIQVTNSSKKTLNLPVGTNGSAVWSKCSKAGISEVDLSLQIAGAPIPAANLPSVHSCAAIRNSFATVKPGASVIFQGALPKPLAAKEGVGVAAVVSVCSAVYDLDSNKPVTTRLCGAPSVSHSLVE